jgi:hypothetical protein
MIGEAKSPLTQRNYVNSMVRNSMFQEVNLLSISRSRRRNIEKKPGSEAKGPKIWSRADSNQMYIPRGLDRGMETLRRVKTIDCVRKFLF